MDENSARADGRDLKTGRFLPGNGGNGGRQKGSRNKLGEKFIADTYEEWKRSGLDCLKRMAKDDPGGFVRIVAGVLPAKLDILVEHQLFADAENFAQAFRLARQFVTEEPPLEIEYAETRDRD